MRYITMLASILFYTGSVQLFAQKTFINTEKPQQGKEITVSFQDTTGSESNSRYPLFIGINCWNEEGELSKMSIPLIPTGSNIFSAVYQIPADAAFLNIRFYHLHRDYTEAAISQITYNENGKIARGASYQQMSGSRAHQQFKEEINRYPENYFAYARYINVLPDDTIKSILPELVSRLEKVKKRDHGLLSALCIARTKEGKAAEAYALLIDLMQNYPATPATAFALSHYLYEQFKTGGSMMATGELYELLRKIFIEYPDCAVSRDHNNIITVSKDTTVSTEAFERVIMGLYSNNQADYLLLGVLPNFYLKKDIKLDKAEALLQDAITSFISGEIYHQYRLPASYTYTYLTEYLRILSRVYQQQGKPVMAVLSLTAALQQVKGSLFEGSTRPGLETELARSYEQAGNTFMSLDIYKNSYLNGNEKVKDSIALLYRKTFSDEAFNKFMFTASSTADTKTATVFSGTTLSGDTISLTDFKGKVVVLNAWFIGCAPCIAEMPELNKLVEQYAENNDIAFLALTPDSTPALKKFIEKTSFRYQIINNLKNIAPYNFEIYPQHIIIDKDGKMAYRSSGSSPEIKNILNEQIKKLLK